MGPHLHIGELELDRLELVDLLAELAPLARVGHRIVGGPLGDAHRLGRGAQAGALERGQGHRQPLAHLAHDVLGRHPHALEDRLAGGRAADAELVLELADGEAGAVRLHDECADAV